MTLAEWVRQALAHVRLQEPLDDVEKKLKAIRSAVAHNAGIAVDIETMLSEIEQGHLSGQR
jgi:hypothetical protein